MAHRDDIQGLRGVAVLLVVLAHAGVPFLRGGYVGVDVFFVLSGFLITGLLLADAAKHGRVALGNFYVRRARRILPAAALTLVATDIAARHLLNFVRAGEAVSDSIWAALFGANLHFAQQGSDYFNQGQPPSPFLHFWTLSVEEQFYLAWPSVLALVLLITAARRRLLIVVGAIGLASLAWSILDTAESPVTAYFSTFTRAWELALGAALSIWAPRARAGLGWLGLAAIGCAAVLFSSGTPFPGYAALLPAVGAALVISGGARALSCAPLRYVGDRSYAYYLWHWPVLIIAAQSAGHELSIGVKLLLVAGAFLLSIVSYRLVENPIRRMRTPRGGLLLPASAAIVVSLVALISLRSISETAGRIDEAAAAVRPHALLEQEPLRTKPLPAVVAAVRAAERGAPIPWPLTPPVGSLRGDFYSFPDGCTATGHATSSKVCRLGDTSSRKTIVVVGDSHAQMWMPTILQLAQHDSWAVVPLVKLGCIPRTWTRPGECRDWYRWAKRRASALRPDVALIAASWAGTYDPPRAIRPIRLLSTAMKRSAVTVMVVGDPSSQRRDPVDCLLAKGATMKTCTSAQQKVQARTDGAIAADARRHGVGFIDARGWLCARARRSPHRYLCPLVVNKTIASLDRGHISKTYALELAPPFRTAFRHGLFG
jgi:peptidoglycan/LPS O-acetylase OafA/YrhL